MTSTSRTWWTRQSENPGLWEHRGKVALVGRGHSPTDRRWDEKLEHSLGAYAMIAAQKAMEDAGISPDEVDGVISCPGGQSNGGNIGDFWAPRPYFYPPYDSEDGLTKVTADWLTRQMGLNNVKYLNSNGDFIWMLMGLAFQAVGDGLCNVALVVYPTGNLAGRYHHTENADLYARGNAQWTKPSGWSGGGGVSYAFLFDQYCRKYGSNHDPMASFIVNQRRNGLMFDWGYYTLHEPYLITEEDYLNGYHPIRA